jgi:hypothetical protein
MRISAQLLGAVLILLPANVEIEVNNDEESISIYEAGEDTSLGLIDTDDESLDFWLRVIKGNQKEPTP